MSVRPQDERYIKYPYDWLFEGKGIAVQV